MSEFRNRVVAPILVPLAGLIVVGAFVFAFSRVLLAVPKYWSVSLAGVLAAEVLGIAALLAAVRKVSGTQRALVGLLGVIVLVGGGVGMASGIRPIEAHHDEIIIAAQNNVFSVSELAVPADAPFALVFNNDDQGIPHNVSVLSGEEILFPGEIINGPASITYEVPALAAGSYEFRCDVHPEMTGTMNAGDESGGHGSGDEGGEHDDEGQPAPTGEPTPTAGGEHGAARIVSENNIFEPDSLTIEAGVETHLTFQNDDAGIPHNVSIYTDETASENLFRGETITGPTSVNYVFTIDTAGEYFFRCDIHPDMVGRLIAE